MRGWMKGALGAGVVVVVAAIGGAALVDRSLDQDRLRRAVIASIERQSGRTVTLQALSVHLLPSPRIEATGFTLSNPAGDADPVMLRLGAVQARLGLWPLLRHVVRLDGLRIEHASLGLERAADGQANWQMRPKRRAAGPGSASTGHAEPWGMSFGSVQVLDAALSLRDLRAHRSGAVRIMRLAGTDLQGGHPAISVAGNHGAAGFTVTGSIGPIGRLFDASDRTTPWPVALQLAEQVAGRVVAQGSLDGTLADPHGGRGYDLAARFSIVQLAGLNRLFTHARLPAMQDLSGSAHVIDAGHPLLTSLQAQAGATALPALHGLILSSWRIDAPGASTPLGIDAHGDWRGRPLRLHGTAGTLATVQAIRAAGALQPPTPVSLQLETAGAAVRAVGKVGGGGGDLRLDASVADLPALLPGAPALGPVTGAGRLRSQGGRLFQVTDLSVGSAAGDIEGSLGLRLDRKPLLTGSLTSRRLDADRLGRWSHTSRPPAPAPALPAPALAPAPAAPVAPTSPPAPATATSSPPRLSWALLTQADVDLAVHVDELLVAGQSLRGLVAHAVLRNGRLLVDPMQAEGDAGPVSARLSADASAAPPHLELTMHPLFVPAAALAGWLGEPAAVQGAAELVGEVQARGDSRQALAASASGQLGVSLVNGSVQNDALLRLLGHSLPLSMALPKGGSTGLRCLALHAALGDGVAHFDTISLHTDRASVDGHGTVGLEDGALDLRLVPFVAFGGAGASMPVRIIGNLRQPRPGLEAGGPDGRTTLVIGPQEAGAADCDAALRSAREGVAGPAPVAMPEHRHKNTKALDILRGLGLFR